MQTKPIKLTKGQKFRQALTHAAIQAQDQIENGRPVKAMQEALLRAVDRKLDENPRFAWR